MSFGAKIAEVVGSANSWLNGIVWGIPILVLIVGTGIFLTIRNRGVQVGHFGYAMKNTLGKIFKKSTAGKGEVTPFQAMTTALAATVGTGNIAGVTAAITLGGPGAVFWLWITAIIGMCTKYAEVVLAVKFREKNKEGDWVGGPMYYIKNGLGKNWKWLSVLFCIFGALAAFGIGNAVQVGNITDSVNTAIQAFNPAAINSISTINLVIGIVVAILVAITLLGGIKRLGQVTELLVPFMSLIYIICSIIVLIAKASNLGSTFGMIFSGAFKPNAFIGGMTGAAIKTCITWGVKRGVFSNEAGLGSAPIAHAATSETNPVKQGLYGIFEVFMDTIVICSLSGLTLLVSGIPLEFGVQGTTALNAQAFGTVFGPKFGSLVIAVGMTLFALSTVLSWGLYGSRCCEFMLGTKSIKPYYIIFTLVTIVGATMKIGLAWDIADTLNGLMAIPNLIALLGLSGVVVKLTRDHFKKGSLQK